VTLTVYKSSKMRLLAFRYKRFIEYDLIHDHFDVGATNPTSKSCQVNRQSSVQETLLLSGQSEQINFFQLP
jgi:hypothetical protein